MRAIEGIEKSLEGVRPSNSVLVRTIVREVGLLITTEDVIDKSECRSGILEARRMSVRSTSHEGDITYKETRTMFVCTIHLPKEIKLFNLKYNRKCPEFQRQLTNELVATESISYSEADSRVPAPHRQRQTYSRIARIASRKRGFPTPKPLSK